MRILLLFTLHLSHLLPSLPFILTLPSFSRSPSTMTIPCYKVAQPQPVVKLTPRETEALLPQPTTAIRPPCPNSINCTQQQTSELYGYSLMALSSIGFSAMSLLVHIATTKYDLSSSSCFFIRAVVQATLSYLYIAIFLNPRQILISLTPRQWKLLAFRGIIGSIAMAAFFHSLQLLPIGDAVSIFFISPILTMLLSSLILAEPITRIDAIAAAVSFSGIILVARPGFGSVSSFTPHRIVGVLSAMAAALFSAFAYVTVRNLGTSVHFMTNVFSLGFASVFTSLILGGAITPAYIAQMTKPIGLALLSSLFAFGAQSFLNNGLQHCPAGPGALVRNLDVPMAFILGLTFLKERPNITSFVGSSLVVCGTVMIGLRKIIRS